jgi:chaperonin cofactor prefoldin
VPDKPANEEIERLHRRREELKKQSEEIEKRLEQLQSELKKVTGRIILPNDAASKKPREGSP